MADTITGIADFGRSIPHCLHVSLFLLRVRVRPLACAPPARVGKLRPVGFNRAFICIRGNERARQGMVRLVIRDLDLRAARVEATLVPGLLPHLPWSGRLHWFRWGVVFYPKAFQEPEME